MTGLAADQLVSLLQDAATRRCATTLNIPGSVEEWEGAWALAVADVHLEYFEEYNRWCNKLSLPVGAFFRRINFAIINTAPHLLQNLWIRNADSAIDSAPGLIYCGHTLELELSGYWSGT